MIDVKQMKKERFEFLITLYGETNGDTSNEKYTVRDISEKLSLEPDEAEKIARYLRAERLNEMRRLLAPPASKLA
jgi:predicted ATP-dependent Lon-type protease